MSETKELKTAQNYIATGKKDKALPLLWKLYDSRNATIRMGTGLALLVTLDHVTQNEKLLEVTDKTLETANSLGRNDVCAYLFSKKAQFLFTKLSNLTYRQHNLNLAAGVFEWIDFSLEIDKLEFEELAKIREELKKEIKSSEVAAVSAIQSSSNHYMRGHIFLSLGEIYFSRFLHDQLDLYQGGKTRSKILNFYFVRRWNLDKIIGYNRSNRKVLKKSQKDAVAYFNNAIEEFRSGGYKADLAHALYDLSIKFTVTYCFHKAQKYLNQARRIAEDENESALFTPIKELQKQIKDKYRHPKNYVEEFGMDLPRALRE